MTQFRGETIYAGFRDARDIQADELQLADYAATEVAARAGRTILVTCMAGRNRSGLVTALALNKRGVPPNRAIALIQRNRLDALSNPVFVEIIRAHG